MTTTPCADRPDVDWHADHAKERATAALACRGCPVQLACAADAIERRERWGVWGGFDFEDITQHAKERERTWAAGAKPRTSAQCGTPGGANRHYRAGEKPCTACAVALNHHRRMTRRDRGVAA